MLRKIISYKKLFQKSRAYILPSGRDTIAPTAIANK